MTFDTIFKTVLEANLINFLIMISVLVWIFKKFNLGKMIDEIELNIRKNISISSNAVMDALGEYKKTSIKAIRINDEKEEIIKNANSMTKKIEERNLEEIENKKSNLDKSLEKIKTTSLERKTEKTANSLQDAIYELSLDTINSMMTDEMKNKMVIEALNELDSKEVIYG